MYSPPQEFGEVYFFFSAALTPFRMSGFTTPKKHEDLKKKRHFHQHTHTKSHVHTARSSLTPHSTFTVLFKCSFWAFSHTEPHPVSLLENLRLTSDFSVTHTHTYIQSGGCMLFALRFVDLQSCVVALEAGMNHLFCTYRGSKTRAGKRSHTQTRTNPGGAASSSKHKKAAHRTFSKDGRTVVEKLNTFIKVGGVGNFFFFFSCHRGPARV